MKVKLSPKNLFLLIVILNISCAISAQTSIIPYKTSKKETPAEFPGGHDSLYCFLENSWNQELINKVDSGIMVFEVLINETGKADSVAFTSFRKKEFYSSLSSVSEITIQNEVKETVAKMPNWRPRMVKKKPNPSWVMIMLVFPYEQKCN